MSRILKLQALSIANEGEVGPGTSTSSNDGCACSTTSVTACKALEEFTAI